MQAGAHALSPITCQGVLKKKQRLSLLHSVLLHPQVSAWQLRKPWYACDGCVRGRGIESGQGAGEAGLSWGGGGHGPDCQTASLQLQLPRIQRLAGSQGQQDRAHSGPFTVEWSHTRSSLAQASSGTRQNSLCSTPEDETMTISSKSLRLWNRLKPTNCL